MSPPFCESVMYTRNDHSAPVRLYFITSCLQLTIFVCLLCYICRKQWYLKIKRDLSRAHNILSPFYDKILYYYCVVTIFIFCMLSIKFIVEVSTDDVATLQAMIPITESVSELSQTSMEIFIPFLLMQGSVGQIAFKRAVRGSLCVCIVQSVFVILRYFVRSDFAYYALLLATHALMLLLFVLVLAYVSIYQQQWRHRKRERDKIVFLYIAVVGAIHIIWVISYALQMADINGFCTIVVGAYAYCVLFPLIVFVTIRNDSLFWQNLFKSIQQTSITSIHSPFSTQNALQQQNNILPRRSSQSTSAEEAGAAEVDTKYHEYRQSLSAVFVGDIAQSSNNGTGSNNNNSGDDRILRPLFAAATIRLNIIDYTKLMDISDDPIAVGATSVVHTGYYNGAKVAIKKLMFDQLDLSLTFITDIFRESLNSDIKHRNIVQFKGACLKTPELCLVYEYCNCGDLGRLLLFNFWYSPARALRGGVTTGQAFRMDRAKEFEHRIQILIDICYGMIRLHDECIIHRDLKTENILVHYDEDRGKFIAKVADFGSARKLKKIKKKSSWIPSSIRSKTTFNDSFISNYGGMSGSKNQACYMTTRVGTLAFLAPELLSRVDVGRMKVGGGKTLKNGAAGGNMDTAKKTGGKDGDEDEHYVLMVDVDGTESKEYVHELHHDTQNLPLLIPAENEQEKEDRLLTLYDQRIDVYAFGCIMFEVGYLQRIYSKLDLQNIYEMVTHGKRQPVMSYADCQKYPNSGFCDVEHEVYIEYKVLMNECWAQNCRRRPNFDEVRDKLEHVRDIYMHSKTNEKK